MISHIYKPRRKDKEGKRVIARLYRGRYRLDGDFAMTDIALGTGDKQIAEKKLRDIVKEKEQEQAGLIVPKLERGSANMSLPVHLDDFVSDLLAKGRNAQYTSQLKSRVLRLLKECGWSLPKDIQSDGFIHWRVSQEKLAPKTLNEYLNGVNALLNWMVRHGRIAVNPLVHVELVDLRGRQQKRRAFSDEELRRLLAYAGKYRLLYLTAAYTGLRSAELGQMVWEDVELEGERPHLRVRGETTKNKREAIVPLHPRLVSELRNISEGEVSDAVFPSNTHHDRVIRRVMVAAGIERFDAMKRKLDFHSLRYTFATRLARQGVSQRLASGIDAA